MADGGGVFRGNRRKLTVLDGCLLLIPDSREETKLRQEQAQLEQHRREIEQALALLAQASS